MSYNPKKFPITPKFIKPNINSLLNKKADNGEIYEVKPTKKEQTPLTLPVLPSKFTDKKIKQEKSEIVVHQDLMIEESPLILYWSNKKIDHDKNDSLAKNVKKCTELVEIKYKSCPKIYGIVTESQWLEILDIYENNQNFFYEKYKNREIEHKKYVKYINDMERWFCSVIEPISIDNGSLETIYNECDRNYRENYKIINSRSYFCKNELIEIISKFPDDLLNFIRLPN